MKGNAWGTGGEVGGRRMGEEIPAPSPASLSSSACHGLDSRGSEPCATSTELPPRSTTFSVALKSEEHPPGPLCKRDRTGEAVCGTNGG
jgi:hypothetical protein